MPSKGRRSGGQSPKVDVESNSKEEEGAWLKEGRCLTRSASLGSNMSGVPPTPPPAPTLGGSGSYRSPRAHDRPSATIPPETPSNYEQGETRHWKVGRLKKKSEIEKMIKQLNVKDWFSWNRSLLGLAYYAEWDESVLNIDDRVKWRWKGFEEVDPAKRERRKQAYFLMRGKVPDALTHLIDDHRRGDAAGIYKSLRFHCQNTCQGAINTLRSTFLQYSMANLGTDLNGFLAKIKSTERELLSVGVYVSDLEKKGILLMGLLMPEFSPAKTQLDLEPANKRSFDDTASFLHLWSQSTGILDLKRRPKAHQGDTRTLVVHQSQRPGRKKYPGKKNLQRNVGKNVCNEFNRYSTCGRGKQCHLIHTNKATHNTSQKAFNCYYNKAIVIEQCPVNLIAEHPMDVKGCRITKQNQKFLCEKKTKGKWKKIVQGRLDRRQGNYDLFMKLRKWNDDGSLAYDNNNHHKNHTVRYQGPCNQV
jgi:hypothetical protein